MFTKVQNDISKTTFFNVDSNKKEVEKIGAVSKIYVFNGYTTVFSTEYSISCKVQIMFGFSA